MCTRDRATREWRTRWLVVGLVVVLAFLGHDLLMAMPVRAMTPHTQASVATSHTVARHARVPHPSACQIGQTMMIQQADSILLQQLSATAFIGALAETREHASGSAVIVAPARSPAVRRAFLQIYRL